MNEKLKNDLLLLLNNYVDDVFLNDLDLRISTLLKDYKVSKKNTDITTCAFTLPQTVKIYMVSKKVSGLSKTTLELYLTVLNHFFQTLQKNPSDITANDVRTYLYCYQRDHHICNRTLDNKRTIICGYFRWLASEEYITKNPTLNIKSIKYEKKTQKSNV